MTMKRFALAPLLAGFAIGLPACSEEQPPPRRDAPEVQEKREEALKRKVYEEVDTQPAEALTGEVPAGIIAVIKADLQKRTGAGEARLIRAEAVNWPDGSMGCGKPGRVYTQVQVPGYHVVFEVGEKRWDYRASETGGFLLCDDTRDLGRPDAYPAQ